MSKGQGQGMDLEQFRNALETDAQKERDIQRREIEGLRELNKKLIDTITHLDHKVDILQNRCLAQTFGVICGHCAYSDGCNARKAFFDQVKKARINGDKTTTIDLNSTPAPELERTLVSPTPPDLKDQEVTDTNIGRKKRLFDKLFRGEK